MQLIAGRTAQEYNEHGVFWEDRYPISQARLTGGQRFSHMAYFALENKRLREIPTDKNGVARVGGSVIEAACADN